MSGRPASTKLQVGDLALSVGYPPNAVPPGWSWVELNDLTKMATGHTPSRSHPEYWGGTIKWMCASDARFQHGGVVYETAETINQLGIENSAAVILPADTVCLARTGASIGYAVRLGEPMATNQGFVNWICGSNLDAKFFQYILVAESDFLKRIAYGAAHHTIYFPEVKAFHVCVPPIAEQRRIVGILDEAFEGLATAKANAEQNLQNVRALFESHRQAVFTQRGEGWVETTLGEQIELLAGFAFKSAQYTHRDQDVRLLRGDNIIQGCLRWDDVKKWPVDDAGAYESYELREGDVVLAMDRPWVKAGLKHATITTDDLPCLLVQRTARLRGSAKLNNRFLMYLIGSAEFTRHILGVQTGIGVPHISGQQIKDFEFTLPPLTEQQRIADNLETLREETKRLESLYQRKLAALDELKKSLLHRAFSGGL